MMIVRCCLVALLLATPVGAQVPKVATDIAPVHSLVSMVMRGLGAPSLLVTPGASPHGYAMRPSQARALQAADLVVWVGPELTPWLGKPIETLAMGAAQLALLDAPGTLVLGFGDEEGAHEEAGHDHDEHSGLDPHAWLDPENGRIWLGLIADQLAEMDPGNAAQYRANAQDGQAGLAALLSELAVTLEPMQDQPYVTFHSAYQYFEDRFGLTPTGSVTQSDARDPSPAALARLRDDLRAAGVTCAFSEPRFDAGLLAAAGGDDLGIIMLDPMGSRLEVGAGLYPALLRDLGAGFARCTAKP
jgi:zinc transport system substrate-binding protein